MKQADRNRKRTTLTFDPEIFKAMNHQAIDESTSVSRLLEKAFLGYLESVRKHNTTTVAGLNFNNDVTIEELDFTVRTFNVLKKAGIDTLSQLRSMSEDDILKIKNLGRKSFEEIKEKLK